MIRCFAFRDQSSGLVKLISNVVFGGSRSGSSAKVLEFSGAGLGVRDFKAFV